MADDKTQDFINDRKIDGVDSFDQTDGDGFVDSSSVISSSSNIETSTTGSVVSPTAGREDSGLGNRIGLADRLTEILLENGDGDLLLQRSDREGNFLQWLQALDLQVMGACRADERLKPLLKMKNASGGAAEDRLLAHLSQHFEAAEVGLLARCLCVPLVSIRVGKVIKQGTLLCPTSSRGNLNLTMLPSSDLHLSFVGDDDPTERLATFGSVSECSAVIVEEIPQDKSGRCFLINIPQGEIFYFWCSEKSKILGHELLSKMKDLLKRKPTLAEFTGISESHLECFATHLRAYFIGSNASNTPASTAASLIPPLDLRSDTHQLGASAASFFTSAKPLRSRHSGGQALSPRSSSFKEGLPRTISSLRNASREKLRRRADAHISTGDSLTAAASFRTPDAALNPSDMGKNTDAVGSCSASPLSFLASLEKSAMPLILSTSQHPHIGSLFSPYYCWCPPCTFPLTKPNPRLPFSLSESLSLPPLSSLLPASRSASYSSEASPFNPADTPLDFPPLLPDPLLQLPFSKQASQQVATFTPLMCDPIVHIPVIDVCSSGQGYLVSAGPAIATSISPLLPKLVSPLIAQGDTMVDNGARETLRLLIGSSSQSTTPLIDTLPGILSNDGEKRGLVAGSRGLYSGTSDADAIAKSFSAVGLVPLSGRAIA
ncbi:hypothetical protein Nepgr_028802 [Nepenthes gracilis]|uniref:Uncharacterized protein n=1 Tax=Nepenthes gracilis TaxID=150966 RepID=A0AAD3TDJ4_NEPGR|nr:hypothetical protein Nepgr_028802 [Nepenthes gracilis]